MKILKPIFLVLPPNVLLTLYIHSTPVLNKKLYIAKYSSNAYAAKIIDCPSGIFLEIKIVMICTEISMVFAFKQYELISSFWKENCFQFYICGDTIVRQLTMIVIYKTFGVHIFLFT